MTFLRIDPLIYFPIFLCNLHQLTLSLVQAAAEVAFLPILIDIFVSSCLTTIHTLIVIKGFGTGGSLLEEGWRCAFEARNGLIEFKGGKIVFASHHC